MGKFTETVQYVDGHRERIKVVQDRGFVIRINPMIVNDYLRRWTLRS